MPGGKDVYRLKADAAYFQAIEDRFRKLRGTHLFLSPRDNPLIDSWWEAGVPIEVVLRALDAVFQRRRDSGETMPVLSVAYCRHAVEEEFARWRESRVGAASTPASEGPGPAEAAPFLRRLAAEMRGTAAPPPLDDAIRAAAGRVEEVALGLESDEPTGLSAAEAMLESIEDRLLADLLAALDPAARASLLQEAEREMAPLRPRLTARAWEGNLRSRQLVLLRRRLGLPRLTLYLL